MKDGRGRSRAPSRWWLRLLCVIALVGVVGAFWTARDALDQPVGPEKAPSAEDTPDSPTPGREPTNRPSGAPDLGAADEAARTVLETWSRPGLDYATWWAELKPLLNAQGRQDYAYTDPARVPRLAIRGQGRLSNSRVATSVVVWFTTNRGRYGVQLQRASTDDDWSASRIWFPRRRS